MVMREDAVRIIRYVIAFAGDGCGQCVGETIYRFYCEFYEDIDLTLEELHLIANEARKIFYGKKDDVSFISVENGGDTIANENCELKEKYKMYENNEKGK